MSVAAAIAAALGALIWIASPMITGHREPWDAHGPYYVLSLLTAGAIAGWIEPQRLWRHVVALYIGQIVGVIVMLIRNPPVDAGLWPLTLIVLAICSSIGWISAALAAALRRRVTKP